MDSLDGNFISAKGGGTPVGNEGCGKGGGGVNA
jgi:hypothetical protein